MRCSLADAVVHDGAVGAGAGDGVKADVAQAWVLGALRFEVFDDVDFADGAGCLHIKPGERFHNGGPVPQVRGRAAVDFSGAFAGLGQGAGIARAHQRLPKLVSDDLGQGGEVCANLGICGLCQCGNMAQEVSRVVAGDLCAQMICEPVQLGFGHEQIDTSLGMQDRKPVGDRVVGNVAAPDIEEPHDAVR